MSKQLEVSARHTAIVLRESMGGLQRNLRETVPPNATASQLSALGLLYRHGEMTPSDLANREGVRLQSLTRLLAALEAQEWITRRTDTRDGRRQLLALTANGRRLLAGYVHQREASLERAIAGLLSENEHRLLLQACGLLDRLGAALQEQRSGTTSPAKGVRT